jgi:hypothetical protein
MHVPSNNISWEKIHINARQGWFNEYFFYQELLILMINVSTTVSFNLLKKCKVEMYFLCIGYSYTIKLEKKYAPALDNYGQSCFVRSD